MVTCVDWHTHRDLIVSGGEDKKYKVWDSFGRLIYASPATGNVITSVKWSPQSTIFAIGSLNSVRVSNAYGYSYKSYLNEHGSLQNFVWTKDGLSFVGASLQGKLLRAVVTDTQALDDKVHLSLKDSKTLLIKPIGESVDEELEFTERILNFSLTSDHLLVLDTKKLSLFTYSAGKIGGNPSSVMDVNAAEVTAIQTSSDGFFMADCEKGLRVFGFDGRQLCTIKPPPGSGLSSFEEFNQDMCTLGPDVLILRARSDKSSFLFLIIQFIEKKQVSLYLIAILAI